MVSASTTTDQQKLSFSVNERGRMWRRKCVGWTMKYMLLFLFVSVSTISPSAAQSQKPIKNNYTIISEVREGKYLNCKTHKETIAELPEPLKAIVAYYGVLYSTNCVSDTLGQTCEFTQALGLGFQGSTEQKQILSKWFTDDLIVSDLIHERNCRVAEPGSSIFTEILYMKLGLTNDTVRVNYNLAKFDHGLVKLVGRKDIAVITSGKINFIRR